MRLLGATFALMIGLLLGATGTPAQAARHALLVGIGDYDQKNNGMATLSAPAYDAEALGRMLGRTAFGFQVDVLVDQAAKDKAAFEAALQKFLARVKPGDEVLFYFSGHGVNLGDKGNYFVLLDAKDQDAYIREQRRKPGSARELDTQDKENKRYEQYLSEVALSEVEIEKAIKSAGADVVIIVADACRVHQADTWAAQSWHDPIEQDLRRRTVRRGAIACWIAAAGFSGRLAHLGHRPAAIGPVST